jgi:hypothetical protein
MKKITVIMALESESTLCEREVQQEREGNGEGTWGQRVSQYIIYVHKETHKILFLKERGLQDYDRGGELVQNTLRT